MYPVSTKGDWVHPPLKILTSMGNQKLIVLFQAQPILVMGSGLRFSIENEQMQLSGAHTRVRLNLSG